MTTLAELAICISKFCTDSETLHKIVTGGDSETISVALDDGSSVDLPSVAKVLKDAGSPSSDTYLLKDLTNALADSLKRLGLDGYDASTKAHIAYTGNLQDIAVNSLYRYTDVADSPQATGRGLVLTMNFDGSNAIQICYIIANNPNIFIKAKIADTWQATWQELSELDDDDIAVLTGLKKLDIKGDILYRGDTELEKLAIGTDGQVLKVSGNGVPSWVESSGGKVAKFIKYHENLCACAGVVMEDGSCRTSWGVIGARNYFDSSAIVDTFYTPRFPSDEKGKVVDLFSTMYKNVFALLDNGNVYGWGGYNSSGALGLGKTSDVFFPEKLSTVQNITDILVSVDNSMFLASDGKLWISGNNNYGTLGNGSTTGSSTPVLLTKQNWKQIFLGNYSCFAIDSNDNLYGWGANTKYKLGIDSTQNQLSPSQILTDVKTISISQDWYDNFYGSVLALKKDGTVWGWGYNKSSELGLNHYDDVKIPTELTGLGNDNKNLLLIGSQTVISAFVLKNDGTVYSCGYNGNGILGQGNTTNLQVFTKSSSSEQVNNKVTDMKAGGSVYRSGTTNYYRSGCFLIYENGSVSFAGMGSVFSSTKNGANNSTSFTHVITNNRLGTVTDILSVGFQNSASRTSFFLINGNIYECDYYEPKAQMLQQVPIF